jgi:hydrogenase nickel incorporation protein HypA/HybF
MPRIYPEISHYTKQKRSAVAGSSAIKCTIAACILGARKGLYTRMHELAIAQNIAEIVRESVPKAQIPAVRTVKMRVGRLAGVVPDSLEFCFSAIAADTELQGARLQIDQIPTTGHCKSCASDFPIEEYAFSCPICGSVEIELVSGTELEVSEIEISEESMEVI